MGAAGAETRLRTGARSRCRLPWRSRPCPRIRLGAGRPSSRVRSARRAGALVPSVLPVPQGRVNRSQDLRILRTSRASGPSAPASPCGPAGPAGSAGACRSWCPVLVPCHHALAGPTLRRITDDPQERLLACRDRRRPGRGRQARGKCSARAEHHRRRAPQLRSCVYARILPSWLSQPVVLSRLARHQTSKPDRCAQGRMALRRCGGVRHRFVIGDARSGRWREFSHAGRAAQPRARPRRPRARRSRPIHAPRARPCRGDRSPRPGAT